MKQIIPFKKDILFKSKINEITDISIEHDYKILDDLVEGDFVLEGTYKMTEASVINEDFFYKIPFTIAISDNYRRETIDLNISDFSYEIKNSDTLTINVDMVLECEENKQEELDEIIEEVLESDEIDINDERDEEEIEKVIEESEEGKREIVEENEIKSIIDSVKEKNEYVTYKVYIAKENDSIESISLKYDISVKELKKYNNENFNVGDKIIIPYISNE